MAVELSGPYSNSWQVVLGYFRKRTRTRPVEAVERPKEQDLGRNRGHDTVELTDAARGRMRQAAVPLERELKERQAISLPVLLAKPPEEAQEILDDPKWIIETTREDLKKVVEGMETGDVSVKSLLETGKFRFIETYGHGSVVDVRV